MHPHGEVVPLGVGRADMFGIGPAFTAEGLSSDDLLRAADYGPKNHVLSWFSTQSRIVDWPTIPPLSISLGGGG